jgi:hypothetical protein
MKCAIAGAFRNNKSAGKADDFMAKVEPQSRVETVPHFRGKLAGDVRLFDAGIQNASRTTTR